MNNPLLFFLFIITVASVVYFLGHQIGYLTGKAEVSNIVRGEPPDIEKEIEHFKAFRADRAER